MREDRLQRFLRLVPELEVAHIVVGPRRQLGRVRQTERAVDRLCDIHDVGDLRLDAALLDEDVRVVLVELLYAEQSVQLARFLFSVDDVGLRVSDRQFFIRALTAAEHVDRVRAVHRLHRVRRILVGRDDEHAVLIVIPVAARDPELLFGQYRARDLLIVVEPVLAAPVCEQGIVKRPAARQEVRHAGSRLVEHEELHLAAELLVVALLRLLDAVEVLLQLVLRRERRSVDSAEHLVLRVAAPVRARRRRQFERLDRAGREEVRPRAQIGEVALPVERNLLALGHVAYQFDLVRLFALFHKRDRLIARESEPLEADILFDDLLHLALDTLEVLGAERLGDVKVVVEALIDRRTYRELDLGEQTLDRLRENVRRRVTERVAPALVGEGIEFYLAVLIHNGRQLDRLAVDTGGEHAHHRHLRLTRRVIDGDGGVKFDAFFSETDLEHIIPP